MEPGKSEAPEIASPIENADESGGFLQETLALIEASHPNFFSSLSPADREALLSLRAECQEELQREFQREFQRIVEGRRAYLQGFRQGVESQMAKLNEDLKNSCEVSTHLAQPRNEDLELIDSCGEATEANEDNTMPVRDPPVVQWGRHVGADPMQTKAREPRQRHNSEPILGANTTHIFWIPPPVLEFDCDSRPLEWCLDIRPDGLRQDVRDMTTGFHGLPLLWRTQEDRIIGDDVIFGRDPRLPVGFLSADRQLEAAVVAMTAAYPSNGNC